MFHMLSPSLWSFVTNLSQVDHHFYSKKSLSLRHINAESNPGVSIAISIGWVRRTVRNEEMLMLRSELNLS